MNGPGATSPGDGSRSLTLRHVLREWLKKFFSESKPGRGSAESKKEQQTEKDDNGTEDQVQGSNNDDGSNVESVNLQDGENTENDGTKQIEEGSKDRLKSKAGDAAQDVINTVYEWEKDMEAVLHGIPAPLDIPLHWLAINMSYADNFLYVVVRKKKHRPT